MDGFTFVDGIVAVVIILSAILAYSRGFVRESLSIAGWIGAAVLAFLFATQARPLVAQIPGLDSVLDKSCELATIAGFAAVFALALVVFSILTPLFSSVVQRSAVGGIDQGLGFLFGVARGILLIAVAFIVYDRVLATQRVASIDNSRSAQIFARLQGDVDKNIPDQAPDWIVRRYEELVSTCPRPDATPTATTPSDAGTDAPAADGAADGTTTDAPATDAPAPSN
ncbi:CvpA family protein [Paracoccus pacificus]|uniref:CvpA family protein n=1 Tax=Paracoccus pacificus TaxID=1463598 RepID=A0ABW4RB60_9RHOB